MARVAGVSAGEVRPYLGPRAAAGIQGVDVALTAVVSGAVELFVAAGSGPGQRPLNAEAFVLGGAIALPVLFRRRWPVRVLIACSLLLIVYYLVDRRNVPPAPLLSVPVYDATVAGCLPWAIGVPSVFLAAGAFFLEAHSRHGLNAFANELPRLGSIPVVVWLLPVMIFCLAVVLGQLVRGRRALAAETAALAAETARRLRIADDERQAEAARRVAEERLRIARELHDTVAHSMATIAVQAGSALQLLDRAAGSGPGAGGSGGSGASGPGRDGPGAGGDAKVRNALAAIRATSKTALSETRAALGQLRQPGSDGQGPGQVGPGATAGNTAAGLGRLPALRDAVAAAGVPVTVRVEGNGRPLPAAADHAAYRIVQESLTNVLRHAGPGACAAVRIRYGAAALTLEVTDDGGPEVTGDGASSVAARVANGEPPGRPRGHGLTGMSERATAAGGELTAGPRPGGGFAVTARLPFAGARAQPER